MEHMENHFSPDIVCQCCSSRICFLMFAINLFSAHVGSNGDEFSYCATANIGKGNTAICSEEDFFFFSTESNKNFILKFYKYMNEKNSIN